MKNLPQLLDCCLLKILPQGFALNGIKANCKAKQKKKKNSKPEDGIYVLKEKRKKSWRSLAFEVSLRS